MIQLGRMYTYEEIMELSVGLKKAYYEMLEIKIVGTSYDGRKIPFLRIGRGKLSLICSAGVHGRESINPVVLLKMVETYCEAYQQEARIQGAAVRELLEQYSIIFLPVLNPDGFTIATQGYDFIRNPVLRQEAKMKGIPYEEWKYNGRGIDINRNFPSRSYQPANRGDYPGSEYETKILMNLFKIYPSVAYLDFHSRGKIIYFYRGAMPEAYNQQQRHLAEKMQENSGYLLGGREEELLTSDSGGNTVHYYSERYGMPAITIETIEDEAIFPLSPKYQMETYSEILAVPLTVLNTAGKFQRF